MAKTIGDDSVLREVILAAGRAKLDKGGGTGKCRHKAGLTDNGPMELSPGLEEEFPDGVHLATCKEPQCGTTVRVTPYRWRQL